MKKQGNEEENKKKQDWYFECVGLQMSTPLMMVPLIIRGVHLLQRGKDPKEDEALPKRLSFVLYFDHDVVDFTLIF